MTGRSHEAEARPPTVVVVDDDLGVCRAMRVLLQGAGFLVEHFQSAGDFLAADAPEGPWCLLLDVKMPGMDGLELQQRLCRKEFPPPVVFISGSSGVAESVQAMKHGAADFLEKPLKPQMVLETVKTALERGERERRRALERAEARRKVESITPREREAARLAAEGHPTREIAARMGISYKTAKVHRARAMEKLGSNGLAELIKLFRKLEPPG